MEGLEPPHLAASDPKSDVSTNFTTSGENLISVDPDAPIVKQVSCQLGSEQEFVTVKLRYL
jgi:hypothetical protein